MIDIDFIKNNADQVLANKGLVKGCEDETVRQFLHHLYVAIYMYRYMNDAERNKAGYWYRIFKGTYTLRNFLKERKRKREKEKSPLHPSNKVKSGVKEKAKTVYIC
jgi:Zn-dependent peptidase ImmA (M78 family)